MASNDPSAQGYEHERRARACWRRELLARPRAWFVLALALVCWLALASGLFRPATIGTSLTSPSTLCAGSVYAAGSRGPRHIFIDVGGNVGDSVAAFLTLGVPGLAKSPKAFDDIIVFEPNPAFAKNYDRYRGKAFNFTFIPAAVAGNDGRMVFEGGGLGGALTTTARETSGIGVPVLDFSKWLRANVGFDDTVVCKIDAEGSEFEIVQRMMADGTLCLCDRLTIEWHGWIGSSKNPELVNVMHPSEALDQPDAPYCLGRSDCYCHIPHLNRRLPYFYCFLPRITLWARKACVSVGGITPETPLLEHHELWWPDVGSPHAFESYPETGA